MTDKKRISIRKGRGTYSISAVAEMFGVHQQTIRLYEKEGLICPNRSSGNTRKFTEQDVDQLEEVIYLTHKLGVNLAGVNMILKLKKKINKMQEDLNLAFENTRMSLDKDELDCKHESGKYLQRLLQIKQENEVGKGDDE